MPTVWKQPKLQIIFVEYKNVTSVSKGRLKHEILAADGDRIIVLPLVLDGL